MTLREFEGQPYVTRALRNAVKHDRLAHAYLFVGPAGIGKREVALGLAQALNCRKKQNGDACGVCQSCEKIRDGNHPDVKVIEPGGASIGINAVREGIVQEVSYRPYEGRYRTYIIHQADKMTTEAANSLLKVLEEPPSYVAIVLLTANQDALLPTIRSRVQRLTFREVPRDILVPKLQEEYNVSAERAAFYSALARGNPGEARRLAASETLLSDRQQALELLCELMDSPDDMVIFDKASELAERGSDLGQFIELLTVLLRDMELLAVGSTRTRLVNCDIGAELARRADRLAAGKAGTVLQLAEEALRALGYNANTLLTCEVFLLKARRTLTGVVQNEQLHLIQPFANS